jgi:hypothetical protein
VEAPVDEEEIDSVWDHLPSGSAVPTLDESYLEHLSEHHGGILIDKYANLWPIDRFLNLANPFAEPALNYRDSTSIKYES